MMVYVTKGTGSLKGTCPAPGEVRISACDGKPRWQSMTELASMRMMGRGRGRPVGPIHREEPETLPLGWMFAFCGIAYLGIYAVEAPIRYLLYLHGRDNVILLRDALISGPLVVLCASHVLRLRIDPAFVAFGVLVLFHGLVLIGTVGSVTGVAYGIKIIVNALFGYFVASLLLVPGRRGLMFLGVIWLVTLVGVTLDKFLVTFPWLGIKTVVGDLTVDVSKDWQIQAELSRRVAGFARSSISIAALLPPLTIVLMCRARHMATRLGLAAISVGSVFLTTQKGSFIAFAPVAAILAARPGRQMLLLRLAVLIFASLTIGLPILTSGLHLSHGSGVFSTESLYLRISETWPDAWRWIFSHQMLVFGVGLGGIGGAQRIYAPASFNPADNFFILTYAYFGAFAIFYMAFIGFLALRPITGSEERAVPGIAIVAFLCGYGTVLSVIEDQSAALFLGAALGVLARETRVGEACLGSRVKSAQSPRSNTPAIAISSRRLLALSAGLLDGAGSCRRPYMLRSIAAACSFGQSM